jgi:multicomponent Na+:H+ antiporter subunit D
MDRLGLGEATAVFAALTIVLASVIALTKDDLKARLAYSTVSQLSYVVLGVSMLTPLAVTGGVAHIAHHAFSKITLFFTAGAIYVASHQKKISMMAGLGRRMPWTFGAFAIASLSMIGIPPVCGFVSKWYMVNGAVSAGHYALLAALLASTILNAAYFTPVVYKAFFEEPAPGVDLDHYHEAPLSMVAPLCFTAAVSVFLGLYPETFIQFIRALKGF